MTGRPGASSIPLTEWRNHSVSRTRGSDPHGLPAPAAGDQPVPGDPSDEGGAAVRTGDRGNGARTHGGSNLSEGGRPRGLDCLSSLAPPGGSYCCDPANVATVRRLRPSRCTPVRELDPGRLRPGCLAFRTDDRMPERHPRNYSPIFIRSCRHLLGSYGWPTATCGGLAPPGSPRLPGHNSTSCLISASFQGHSAAVTPVGEMAVVAARRPNAWPGLRGWQCAVGIWIWCLRACAFESRLPHGRRP